ncbi:MAG: hypothetical protein U0271_24660 [Polyangiaceae bacterium]
MDISRDAIDLIIAWEVGGGDRQAARPQYDRQYTHPHWPGNSASGLTIGIGYDLRFARSWFEGDWKAKLDALQTPADAFDRLKAYVGLHGSTAAVRATRDIAIPWDDAISVFRVRRLPHFADDAASAFPGLEAMNADVRGALTSLVYNCGTGTQKASQVLKKAAYDHIRSAVAAGDIAGVAEGLRMMKAYHNRSPKVARGLNRRRDAEAELVLQSAAQPSAAAAAP